MHRSLTLIPLAERRWWRSICWTKTAATRTEFPDIELQELTEDIRERGILQPPRRARCRWQRSPPDSLWRQRLRAAARAGMTHVPVVISDLPADPYAQVAENQKRHGLSPLDLARFIKSRSEAGDSNATIAKRLGMNLTSVAHHLTLLELPPELDQALKEGRCTSPRTLHELRKLHHEEPDRVRALVAGLTEITRTAVTALRANAASSSWGHACPVQRRPRPARANPDSPEQGRARSPRR